MKTKSQDLENLSVTSTSRDYPKWLNEFTLLGFSIFCFGLLLFLLGVPLFFSIGIVVGLIGVLVILYRISKKANTKK